MSTYSTIPGARYFHNLALSSRQPSPFASRVHDSLPPTHAGHQPTPAYRQNRQRNDEQGRRGRRSVPGSPSSQVCHMTTDNSQFSRVASIKRDREVSQGMGRHPDPAADKSRQHQRQHDPPHEGEPSRAGHMARLFQFHVDLGQRPGHVAAAEGDVAHREAQHDDPDRPVEAQSVQRRLQIQEHERDGDDHSGKGMGKERDGIERGSSPEAFPDDDPGDDEGKEHGESGGSQGHSDGVEGGVENVAVGKTSR